MLIKQYVRTIYFLGLKSCKWCIDGGGKGGNTPPPGPLEKFDSITFLSFFTLASE